MWFILFFILLLAALAYGVEQVIDQPGSVTIDWSGYHLDASIPVAVAALLIAAAGIVLVWTLVTSTFKLPQRMREGLQGRRREMGFAAVTKGIVAAASGDAAAARDAAKAAEKLLPDEPLVHYLKSQAAQIEGDFSKAEAAFQRMTLKPETRLLGLRGLHIQAQRRADSEAAHYFAKEAHEIAPLPWAGTALLEHYAAAGEWDEARKALEESYKVGGLDAAAAERYRAVLETAAAMQKEARDPQAALHLAHLALKRRPNFVPALLVAARVLIKRNDPKLAAKLIEKAWPSAPHPELATAYLDSFPSETNALSPRRVRRLRRSSPKARRQRRTPASSWRKSRTSSLVPAGPCANGSHAVRARLAIPRGSPTAWSREAGRRSRPRPGSSTLSNGVRRLPRRLDLLRTGARKFPRLFSTKPRSRPSPQIRLAPDPRSARRKRT